MQKLLLIALIAGVFLVPLTQAEEHAGISNRLKWVTATEVNNFGFDVYRGDFEDGPFVRINEDTIPGAGSSDTPNQYEYIDDTIAVGKAYWYYVESISMSSKREKFTPTFQASAKFPATDQ